jgi:hypothetical protein
MLVGGSVRHGSYLLQVAESITADPVVLRNAEASATN